MQAVDEERGHDVGDLHRDEVRAGELAEREREAADDGHGPGLADSARARRPCAIRISGTIRARKGVWRPTIAPRSPLSRPVMSDSVTIGMAIAPNATGAVFATSASDAALIGRKPRPISITALIATGRAEAGERLHQRAEAERDDHGLDALVLGDRAERAPQHREVPGLDGHVVDPDRHDHDPHDREEAEHGALARGQRGLADRHAVDDQRDEHRHSERDQRRPLRLHLQAAEQHEQGQDRQRREDRGQAERVRDRVEVLRVHRNASLVGSCAARCPSRRSGKLLKRCASACSSPASGTRCFRPRDRRSCGCWSGSAWRSSFPEEQTCCGQMHLNSGYADEGLALARRLAAVFEGYEAVVTPSASCAGMVREQLGADALPVYELSEFLVRRAGGGRRGRVLPAPGHLPPDLPLAARAARGRRAAAPALLGARARAGRAAGRARVLRVRRDVRGEERGRVHGDAGRQDAQRARHARGGGLRGRLVVPDAHRRRARARPHRRPDRAPRGDPRLDGGRAVAP